MHIPRKALVSIAAALLAVGSFALGAIFWRQIDAPLAALTPMQRTLVTSIPTLALLLILVVAAARKRRARSTTDEL